jgi:hypothetical protein
MPRSRLRAHKAFLGLGFLIRQRRLAEAILQLGTIHAYEGRMLLRSMIEILINHAWIGIAKGHSRARRFIRFEPLERQRIFRDVAAVYPKQAAGVLARFAKEQIRVRHLFNRKDPKTGKHSWAKSWASKSSLRDRLVDVLDHEAAKSKKPRSDVFMYGVYAWTSSAVHGGPLSISDMLYPAPGGWRVRRQPESNPRAQMLGAATFLVAAIDRLTAEARARKQYRRELVALVAYLKKLRDASEANKRVKLAAQTSGGRPGDG